MLVVSSNDRTTAVLRQYAGVRERPLSTLRWTIRNEKEAAKELEARISNSVRERMMSDVPLGALFSGGIDSTTVVAMMQRASPHPVKTFTVGFDERAFNEAAHARRLAAYLGTDHHEIYVRARDALDVIPELPEIWDEPFADPSQLPCYIVSRFARQHVTVALAGDGGDELFCGYRHYAMAGRMHRLIHVVPGPVRRALATATRAAAGLRLCLGPARARLAERAARVGHVLASHSVEEFCESLLAVYQDAPLVLGCTGGIPRLFDCDPKRLVECLMEGDLLRYLPENIMTKTDRASMGVSLEIRAPFLDPALVDFARSIPLDLKLRNGQSKWLLRQVLYGLVPRDLVDRPKTGFSVPLARWLNCELLPWAEELLSVPSLMKSDVFHVERVRAIWHEHREGLRLRQRVLWNVLMFQAWWFRTQRRATLIASPVKVSQ